MRHDREIELIRLAEVLARVKKVPSLDELTGKVARKRRSMKAAAPSGKPITPAEKAAAFEREMKKFQALLAEEKGDGRQ